MSDPNPQTIPEPHEATDGTASEEREQYGMRELAGDIGAGVRDELLGWVFTGLMWVGIILAWVLPLVGLIVGGVSIFLAARSGRSLLLPIVIAVFAVIAWVVTQSPWGLFPLVASLF